MAKNDNLKDYLTDLYEGIKAKKPNASRNPQDFRNEIESISGGGVQIVDELPTNPEENVIYEEKECSDIDVLLVFYNKEYMSLEEIIKRNTNPNANISYYVVDELPTTPLECDFVTFTNLYVYICDDISYAYGNLGSGNIWVPVSQILTSMATQNETFIDKGFIKSLLYLDTHASMLDVYLYVTYKKNVGINNKYGTKLFENGVYTDYEAVFNKTIEYFRNDDIKIIPPYALTDCYMLKEVYCENVKIVENYAFSHCYLLSSIYLPNVEELCYHSFFGSVIKELRLEKLKSLGDSVFENSNIETIYFPNAKTAGLKCFYNCNDLKNVYIPQISTLNNYTFYNCSNLINIELQYCVNVYSYCFAKCNQLETIRFSSYTTRAEENLKIDFKAFYNCTALKDIYINNPFLTELKNVDAFEQAGTTQGYINIHVRPELASEYETATNWSSLIAEGKIKIIGDYIDE